MESIYIISNYQRYNCQRSNSKVKSINLLVNLLIIISYYKLLNVIAAMILKYMKFTCPTNRKVIHV